MNKQTKIRALIIGPILVAIVVAYVVIPLSRVSIEGPQKHEKSFFEKVLGYLDRDEQRELTR